MIDLISIGIVCEDGRELYCQSTEYDASKASQWVQDNVLAHLEQCESGSGRLWHATTGGQCIGRYLSCGCPWYTREQMKDAVCRFMDVERYGKPELWGWCAGYDWVAFCQLFGTMMDLPAGWPHYIRDIQYLLDERDMPDDLLPVVRGPQHDALSDARYIRQLWLFLTEGVE